MTPFKGAQKGASETEKAPPLFFKRAGLRVF